MLVKSVVVCSFTSVCEDEQRYCRRRVVVCREKHPPVAVALLSSVTLMPWSSLQKLIEPLMLMDLSTGSHDFQVNV